MARRHGTGWARRALERAARPSRWYTAAPAGPAGGGGQRYRRGRSHQNVLAVRGCASADDLDSGIKQERDVFRAPQGHFADDLKGHAHVPVDRVGRRRYVRAMRSHVSARASRSVGASRATASPPTWR